MERVASLAALPEGDMTSVTTSTGTELLLIRLGADVYAIEAVCSHQDAWLDGGWVHADTMEVECPLHDGRFDFRSGEATREPATAAIKTFEVRVEGDDVFVGAQK